MKTTILHPRVACLQEAEALLYLQSSRTNVRPLCCVSLIILTLQQTLITKLSDLRLCVTNNLTAPAQKAITPEVSLMCLQGRESPAIRSI